MGRLRRRRRARPQAIALAMITMRKAVDGSSKGMGLRYQFDKPTAYLHRIVTPFSVVNTF